MKVARRLLEVAVALVLVITTASAYLRLSQYGLGCADWPACYGSMPLEQPALDASSPQFWVRAVHRVSATVAGLIFVALALFWWNGWGSARERLLSLAPLALAAFLAWLGRYTPSTLPAVTLGNLLGGMAALGVLWWLRMAAAEAAPGAARQRGLARAAALALALLFAQIALGGLTSARLTAAACPGFPLCESGAASLYASAFDPFADRAAAGLGDAALRAVQLAHRAAGVLLAVVLAWLGAAALRRPRPQAGCWLLGLLAAQLALAAAMVTAGFPLALAVAHNLVAALLVLALVSLLAPQSAHTGNRQRGREQGSRPGDAPDS